MLPVDGIRSQLEWFSTLSPTTAQLPTAENKFLRKVSPLCCSMRQHQVERHTFIDCYHRHHRYACLQSWSIVPPHGIFLPLGPKVNTVEKLAELKNAGVNIGVHICIHSCADTHRLSVRMNFSHGSYEYHQSVIDNTRKMIAGMLAVVGAPFIGPIDVFA